MAETTVIVDVLKKALRRNGITYADVAKALDLSESSVKRLFATRNLSLRRLDDICRLAGMEITDLLRLLEERGQRIDELSEEVEAELVGDPKLLLVAYSVLHYRSFDEIIETFAISETECIQLLARLDRMRLIELLPGNKTRLLVSRNFKWRPDGPIDRYFRSQVQSQFFASRFREPGECRVVLNGIMSRASCIQLAERMQRVADEFEEANIDDRRLPGDQREGTTMVLAIRPWTLDAFVKLQRKPEASP